MEEKKIEIITKNSDGLYNKVTVHKLEDGSLSKTGDEIAEILLEGDKDSIDTSDFIELDLADGHEHGKIFVNISTSSKQYLLSEACKILYRQKQLIKGKEKLNFYISLISTFGFLRGINKIRLLQ